MRALLLSLIFELSSLIFPLSSFSSPPSIDVVGLDPAVELDAFAGQPAGYGSEQRGHALLHFSGPPELAERLPVPEAYIEQAGGRRPFEAWRRSLRAAAGPAFDAVFAAEKAALAPDIRRFADAISSGAYIPRIEAYSGLTFEGDYRIAVSTHYPPGSMVNNVMVRPDGGIAIASLFGSTRAADGSLDFALQDVPPAVWHELAHGTLDALTDLNGERLARSAALRSAIPGGCYGEWRQCVKEHVVRAVYLRLMDKHYGAAAAARARRQIDTSHFPYLDAMTARLKEFEADRVRWPTLAEFFPRLLDTLPKAPGKAHEPPPSEPAVAEGFPSRGQRERAVRLLDGMLAAGAEDGDRLQSQRDALQKLIDEIPPLPPLVHEGRAGVGSAASVAVDTVAVHLRQQGISLYASNKRAQALGRLEAARAKDPSDPETDMDLGVALQAAGRNADAAEAYTRAIERFRAERFCGDAELAANTLSSRASLRRQTGDAAGARADLREALVLAPPDWRRRVETEQQLRALGEPEEPGREEVPAVTEVTVSPDGRYLASLDMSGTAIVRDLRTDAVARRFDGLLRERAPTAFSPSGDKYLVWSLDYTGALWDLAASSQVQTFHGLRLPVSDAAFMPDGRGIVTVGDGQPRLWDVATGASRPIFPPHVGTQEAVVISPDGHLAVTIAQGIAQVWDVASQRPLFAFPEGTPTTWQGWAITAAFSPDSRSLAIGMSSNDIRLFEVAGATQTLRLVGHHDGVETVAFVDARTLVSASRDATAATWDLGTGQKTREFLGHRGAVLCAVVLPGGRLLATGGTDGTTRIWELASGSERCRLGPGPAGSCPRIGGQDALNP